MSQSVTSPASVGQPAVHPLTALALAGPTLSASAAAWASHATRASGDSQPDAKASDESRHGSGYTLTNNQRRRTRGRTDGQTHRRTHTQTDRRTHRHRRTEQRNTQADRTDRQTDRSMHHADGQCTCTNTKDSVCVCESSRHERTFVCVLYHRAHDDKDDDRPQQAAPVAPPRLDVTDCLTDVAVTPWLRPATDDNDRRATQGVHRVRQV